ncbi:tetratricopeptide repeat protein [Sphingopyxis yananensis]|uniref:tetratricopeptide repeat protein n=1 Tax=Sphingopyxis yananensis TaxID=2886687 RepID=UPI001D106BBA|nr:tetratricopeptide repeat protein [Sphingopyxis yananensis]MCC2601055.1 tetratricopeptide repeat protein [Sphingopyxis yananensis]
MLNRFRTLPATAMAAVLGLTLVAAPSAADAREKPKKEQAAKGKQLSPSRGFQPMLKKLGDAQNAKDAAALQAALAEAAGAATSADDKYLLGFYRLQQGIIGNDQAVQGQGLDEMLDSGMTPPESLAPYNFFSGQFAYQAKNYAKAVTRFEAAKAAGSTEAVLPALLMDSYLSSGNLDKGWEVAQASIAAQRAAGQKPSDELYVRPAQAFQNANRTPELLDVLSMRVEDYPQAAAWRNLLFIMLRDAGGDKALNLDILRLMRQTKSMTERAEYSEYAALGVEAAMPGEVVSVIQQGKAAGVIPAKDSYFDDILESQTPRARDDAKAVLLDAAKPATLSNPRAALGTADALVAMGEYAKAIPLYQAVATSGNPVGQYRLGVTQLLAGQTDAGAATLGQVTTGPRARLAKLWVAQTKAKAAPAAAN